MKIKLVLESQRATGRFRIELETTSLAELREALALFETLGSSEFSDEYLRDLSILSQETIKAWMKMGLKKES